MNKRLLKKVAYWLVAQGGTCDTSDIHNIMQDEGIPGDFEVAIEIAELCAVIKDSLLKRAEGWQAIKLIDIREE